MFSGKVISHRLKFNGIVFNRDRALLKSLPADSSYLAVTLPGRGSGPEARVAPAGHTGIKEQRFQTGSCGEEGGAELRRAGLLLSSVRQRTVVSGGRGRAGDD